MRMEVRRAQFSLLKFKMKEKKVNTKRLSSLNSVSDIFYIDIHIFLGLFLIAVNSISDEQTYYIQKQN